jgi:N utilization substance protein A
LISFAYRPTAKQIILQRIHEAGGMSYATFSVRRSELITGSVQAIDYRSNLVTVSLGKKAEGLLAVEDQLPNDRYRIGQNVRALLAEVSKGTRGPQIRLSRTHRNMLRRLLEREVPEIYNGTVEIKSVAREPGQRSKVAVAATSRGGPGVVRRDAWHAHSRTSWMSSAKIDVVEWRADMRFFIRHAQQPTDRHEPDRGRRSSRPS